MKNVTIFEGNQPPLTTHLATIALYDRATGACRAFMDGTHITAARTAAASAVAARRLARSDARSLLVVGAGVQARWHLAALPLVCDFEEVALWARRPQQAELPARVAEDLEAAVRAADVIALTTGSPEPVIRAEWVKPGAHVSSIGFHPPSGELPRELAERHRLFVETRAAFAAPPVGCAELAGLDPEHGTELGELVAGTRPGRQQRRRDHGLQGDGARRRGRRGGGARPPARARAGRRDASSSSSRSAARGRARAGRRRP